MEPRWTKPFAPCMPSSFAILIRRFLTPRLMSDRSPKARCLRALGDLSDMSRGVKNLRIRIAKELGMQGANGFVHRGSIHHEAHVDSVGTLRNHIEVYITNCRKHAL